MIRADSKAQILSTLAACFADVYALDPAHVLERIMEREALGSTGFGRGVAIPHARIAGLTRPVAAFLRLEKPVEFDAADGMQESARATTGSNAADGLNSMATLSIWRLQ